MTNLNLVAIGKEALQAGYYDAEGGLHVDAVPDWNHLIMSQEGVNALCQRYGVSQADIEGGLTEALRGMQAQPPVAL